MECVFHLVKEVVVGIVSIEVRGRGCSFVCAVWLVHQQKSAGDAQRVLENLSFMGIAAPCGFHVWKLSLSSFFDNIEVSCDDGGVFTCPVWCWQFPE